jgi:hypothetical protein
MASRGIELAVMRGNSWMGWPKGRSTGLDVSTTPVNAVLRCMASAASERVPLLVLRLHIDSLKTPLQRSNHRVDVRIMR